MTLLKELIEIPERLHTQDFVLKLTDGVTRAAQTLGDYEATPQLAKCFDEALALVKSAVESKSSKAAYLHGSFGAGKSHFMAVLHLLLQHESLARSLPGLAEVVARHDGWLRGKKFLRVPYHLLGAVSLESALLGHYVAHLRATHPEAPLPAVFLADPIFDNARRLRGQLGDERFFAELNGGAGAARGGSGWGTLDTIWNATTFEAALRVAPLAPGEQRADGAQRSRLVSDLVARFFPAYAQVAKHDGELYLPLDEGLSVISQHAKALGYDALVLFLDELVLWLAMHVGNSEFIHRETQKLTKLVESQTSSRPIPIVSFIARQRDLRELIGAHQTGAEKLGFYDNLKLQDARFQVVKLEDRNLPAIAEKRVLKPRSEAARQEIDQAFAKTKRVRGDVLDTLLTKHADERMFRQVYPFSPALVEVLVAVSSLLQRERTALKIMVQLLFDRRERLELGQLIPVGDLYDALLEGNDPITSDAKAHFDATRKLYLTKLRPLLESLHSMTAAQAAAAPDDPKARQFRAEDGLMKTLLLAALVPECPVLKELTPARMAALNHGTITTPIPGQEAQLVLKRLRDWAARVGEIRLAGTPNDPNPTVSLQISGVDTEAILEKVAGEDNKGNRIRRLRQMLFESMGVADRDDLFAAQLAHRFEWRGSERQVDIVFQNIRDLPDESFRNGKSSWKLVIDFPFDEEGFSWSDDVERVKTFRAKNEPQRTVCWIPTFFTQETKRDLGQLVKLDYVLASDDRLRQATSHLASADRVSARSILDSQRSALTERFRHALLMAYGVAPAQATVVDVSHDPGQMLRSLDDTFAPRLPVAANLQGALSGLLDQLLSRQFPAHPPFEQSIKAATWKRVKEWLDKSLEVREGRIDIPKEMRQEMRQVAEALKLGKMHESHFVRDRHWRDHLDRESKRSGGEVTVRALREFLDRPTPMGLEPKAQNLILLDYAAATNRIFMRHGGIEVPTLDRIDDELVVKEQALPDEAEWLTAIDRGARLLGIAQPALCSANQVRSFAEEVQRLAKEHRDACRTVAARLPPLLRDFAVEESTAPRLMAARAAAALLDQLAALRPEQVVHALATATPSVSAESLGTAIKGAAKVAAAIGATKWALLEALQNLHDERKSAAAGLRQQVAEALHDDEFARELAPVLTRVEAEAVRLLSAVPRAPAPPPSAPAPSAPSPTSPSSSGSPPTAPPNSPPSASLPPFGGARPAAPQRSRQERLDLAAAQQLFAKLADELRKDGRRRLTVEWELDSDGRAP
ncbi:MAG: phage resistance protein [Planctomycetes bacterium]|nr:phage resistance protein [Planctomycetota bacterium]